MIQRKTSGGAGGLFNENGWEGYKNGFGNKTKGDFWLGLEKIHQMTLNGNWQLMLSVRGTNGGLSVQTFKNFKVSSEDEEYRLIIGSRLDSSSWGDFSVYPKCNLNSHNGAMFTTKDRDNDVATGGTNRAKTYQGGFWYTTSYSCFPPTGARNSYRETSMKIAPM